MYIGLYKCNESWGFCKDKDGIPAKRVYYENGNQTLFINVNLLCYSLRMYTIVFYCILSTTDGQAWIPYSMKL